MSSETPPENLYERLQSTLATHNVDQSTAQLLSLQLAGGVPSEGTTGNDRGHIHLAALFNAQTDASALLTHLSELSPAGTYVNGSGTSFVGLIGGAKGGNVNRGVTLAGEYNHVYIGNAAALDDRIKDATEQIFSRSAYTITKSGIHETFPVDSALLIADTLRGGKRDEYVPLAEELEYLLPIPQRQRCDVVIVDTSNGDKSPIGSPLTIVEAHTGLTAARDLSPSIPKLIQEEIETHHEAEVDGVEIAPPITLESFRQLAVARSRLDYNETVKSTHVNDIVNLVTSIRRNMSLQDEDSFESTSNNQSGSDLDVVDDTECMDHRKKQKEIVKVIHNLSEEYDDGAPTDEVISRVHSNFGIKKSRIEEHLDDLKYRGVAYASAEGHLRIV